MVVPPLTLFLEGMEYPEEAVDILESVVEVETVELDVTTEVDEFSISLFSLSDHGPAPTILRIVIFEGTTTDLGRLLSI